MAGGFIQQKGYQILAADSLYSQTEVLCSSWRFHTAERSSRYRECTVAEQYEDWSGSIEPPATAQNFDLAAETVTCQCLVPPYLFITLGQCNVNIHILINLLLLDRNEYRPLAQRKFPENSRCLSSIIITGLHSLCSLYGTWRIPGGLAICHGATVTPTDIYSENNRFNILIFIQNRHRLQLRKL